MLAQRLTPSALTTSRPQIGALRPLAARSYHCQATRRTSCIVQASSSRAAEPHIQLGTAAIPDACDTQVFSNSIYQWASTMTQSGANYPFALPLKADKLGNGFKLSLLKRSGKASFDSAADIEATVEAVQGKGNVLFIRFYEGPASVAERRTAAPVDATERLSVVLQSLVDVPIIMQTMPNAIRNGVVVSRTA